MMPSMEIIDLGCMLLVCLPTANAQKDRHLCGMRQLQAAVNL